MVTATLTKEIQEPEKEEKSTIQKISKSFNEIWGEVWNISSDMTGLCKMIDTLNADFEANRIKHFDDEAITFINYFFRVRGELLSEITDKIEELGNKVTTLLEETQA